jgi:pSer/pThr/pTyr-binding forkhead associated (FHA) protein
MSARLEVVAGKATGMSLVVDGELVIGRQAQGAGRLADDDEISRTHARVALDASGFCSIEDLGSTNGTFVNGLQISGARTLSEGDTIELGGTTLVVREISTPATQPARGGPQQPPVTPGTDGIAPPPAVLSLQLEVDFATREAKIAFDDRLEPLHLVFEDGQWRPASGSG